MPESSKYLYHTGTGSSALYSKVRVSTQVKIWARRLKPSALLEDHPIVTPSCVNTRWLSALQQSFAEPNGCHSSAIMHILIRQPYTQKAVRDVLIVALRKVTSWQNQRTVLASSP